MSPERAAVIEKVRVAFQNVRLEDGVGLWEAQGIDDHDEEWLCRLYREEDEKEDWSRIPPEALRRCYSSLFFFDPKGMRFHLPAFLIGELDGTVSMGVAVLVWLDDSQLEKFSLLSRD